MTAARDLQTKNESVSPDKRNRIEQNTWEITYRSWTNIKEIAWAGIYWLARIWFRGLFYERTLRGRRQLALKTAPQEDWPGNVANGLELISGRIRLVNQAVSAQEWATAGADMGPAWQAEYHKFDWLGDFLRIAAP